MTAVAWAAPLCAAGGAVGWFTAPLARRFYERPLAWARPGIAVVTALLFGAFAWRFAGRAELVAYLYLAAVGSLLAFIDVAVKRLPDVFTLPSYIVGTVLLGGAVLFGARPANLGYALVGMAALWALYAAQRLALPRAMGGGDVKLAGVLGLYLGWLGVSAWWLGVLAGFVVGGLYATVLLVIRRGDRWTEMPFGPFMLAGALIGILASG